MESRFNIGDTILYQDGDGKYVEGVVQEVFFTYRVQPKEEYGMDFIDQRKAFKDKKEIIEKLGLND